MVRLYGRKREYICAAVLQNAPRGNLVKLLRLFPGWDTEEIDPDLHKGKYH